MEKLSAIISYLEAFAPPVLQEDYDNAGLITGTPGMEVTGAVICLDSTEEVIDEAIRLKFNLVIAHHPIVFGGIKKLNGKNYVEKTLIKAIKNDIAIYAAHTNLDNVNNGVNKKIADTLGLINTRILTPKKNILKKLVTYAPESHADTVRQALFDAGAGAIGNYDNCSFSNSGNGTFRPNDQARPFIGETGKLQVEPEQRIEVIFESFRRKPVMEALRKAHPYEEIAVDIYPLENAGGEAGSGLVGELVEAMDPVNFLGYLKEKMNAKVIRHTALTGKKVRKVALCGGSGSFLLKDAIHSGAEVFITADFKYHQFFDAENSIIIADIGHYESEQFTKELFYEILNEKFPKFALRLSEINTNPINYF